MSYLEPLLIWNVFDEVQVGFGSVLHTGSNIDQTSRTTSRILITLDSIPLQNLHAKLSQC